MTIDVAIPEHLTRLSIRREFAAPPSLLWKMWTDPAHVGVWWGPEHFSTPVVEMDVRPGGAIRMVMRAPDGSEFGFDGRFVSLNEPHELVTRTWVNYEDGEIWFEVEQTIRFEAVGDHTVMHFNARVIEARADALGPLSGMEAGWTGSFDKLDAQVRVVTASAG